MKLIHKLLSLGFIVLLVSLAACEEQRILFEGPAFVRFTDTTLTFKESYGLPVEIKLHIVGKPINKSVTVNYTVAGTAREGRDYTIEGVKGSVIIPANKSFGTIAVNLINNANNILDAQDVVFTLTGVSDPSLQVGFGNNNIIGKTMRLTIQDDCLLSGFYTGRRQGSTEVVNNIAITSLNCRDYQIANWNIGVFNLNAIKAKLNFTDNGDNTLTIPTQVSPDLSAPYDTLRGSGVWNPQTRAILLNVRLKLRVSSTRDTTITVPFTFTPR